MNEVAYIDFRILNREILQKVLEALEGREEQFYKDLKKILKEVLGVDYVVVGSIEYQIPSEFGRKIYLKIRITSLGSDLLEEVPFEIIPEMEARVEDLLSKYDLKSGKDYLCIRTI